MSPTSGPRCSGRATGSATCWPSPSRGTDTAAHPPDRHPLDRPLAEVAAALRAGSVSAAELLDEALARHERRRPALGAYVHVDAEGAREAAREADRRLAAEGAAAPPLCGIPVSVKDLYGVTGQPIWAGTARRLPPEWERDGWLVGRLREQGAVFVGRTHTVELAFGAVGVNPHHGTPRHPGDDRVHRIPGGSSAGAGGSLVEGSALVALGTDTGGSIRIPASLAGVAGHKTTRGRWPTTGVVPLSSTLDTVGALTRTVADALWFFGAVDPAWGDPAALAAAGRAAATGVRVGVPTGPVAGAARSDIAEVCRRAVEALAAAPGWSRVEVDGGLLAEAERLYMEGSLIAAECRAFLERELPEWIDLLDVRVAERLRGAPALDDVRYRTDADARLALARSAPALFADVDVLAWPTHGITPPPVTEVAELDAYLRVNRALLRPTCPVSALDLCAVTLPVGYDAAGLPVGLQLVAPGGRDAWLLGVAARAEAILASA